MQVRPLQTSINNGLAKCLRPTRYEVVADPPGPKIGNGGATLHALQYLEDTFGSDVLNTGNTSKKLTNKNKKDPSTSQH